MTRSLLSLVALTACGGGPSGSSEPLAPAEAADLLACKATLRVWEQSAEDNMSVSADDLNRGGALCLAAGDPQTALALLAAAVDHEPEHALAHHNRARAIAAVLATGDGETACDLGATPASLVGHLQAVHRLDPERLRDLSDLPVEIQTLPPVRMLLDQSDGVRRRTVLAIQGARFSTQSARGTVSITLTGEAPHTDLDHALPAQVDRGPDGVSTGGWAVDEQGQILVDPDDAGPQPPQVFVLTEHGTLQDTTSGQAWSSIPNPCAP